MQFLLKAALLALICSSVSAKADERQMMLGWGPAAKPPIGYVDFCARYKGECDVKPSWPVNVVLSQASAKYLQAINTWVNTKVKPMTDLDHWGVEEKWDYPQDGYGDCEDYVLEKRRLLLKAGWPRQALLITVVRDQDYNGHALLTVVTDQGDFILDSQRNEILLWSQTNYHYVKRQSQSDPNTWISIVGTHAVLFNPEPLQIFSW